MSNSPNVVTTAVLRSAWDAALSSATKASYPCPIVFSHVVAAGQLIAMHGTAKLALEHAPTESTWFLRVRELLFAASEVEAMDRPGFGLLKTDLRVVPNNDVRVGGKAGKR